MEGDDRGFLSTFKVGGMAIATCFIKALFVRGDSHSYRLVVRTADVMLEERRELNLPVGSPIHEGHLELMRKVIRIGGIIFLLYPPSTICQKTSMTSIDD